MRRPFSEEWEAFTAKHSQKTVITGGATFSYVETGSEDATPLVFLNGGMNSSEMWMSYLDCHLLDDYRAIIFDYPMEAGTDDALILAMHEFFNTLNIARPVLIGASFGGMIAQMYARRFREDVGGLVLIATGGLDSDTLKTFRRKYALAPLLQWYMKHADYEKMKPKLIRAGEKTAENESKEDRAYVHEMFTFLFSSYTREKDIHITGLLADVMHQAPMTKDDFAHLQGRILLLFPSDDFFDERMQGNLEKLMLEPEIRRFHGNHASTVLRPELLLAEIVPFLRRIGW